MVCCVSTFASLKNHAWFCLCTDFKGQTNWESGVASVMQNGKFIFTFSVFVVIATFCDKMKKDWALNSDGNVVSSITCEYRSCNINCHLDVKFMSWNFCTALNIHFQFLTGNRFFKALFGTLLKRWPTVCYFWPHYEAMLTFSNQQNQSTKTSPTPFLFLNIQGTQTHTIFNIM